MGWIVINVITSEVMGDNFRQLRHGGIQKGSRSVFPTPEDKKNGWQSTPKTFTLLKDAHNAFHEWRISAKVEEEDLIHYQIVLINKHNEPVAYVEPRKEYTYYKYK